MSIVTEFKAFILRGNVVDLAVGVVIGAAFGKIVASMVEDIFMPVIGLATGGFDVSTYTVGYKDAQLNVGKFLQAVINLGIIGFCLFMAVKGVNLLQKKEQAKPPEMTLSEKLLAEIRDAIKDEKPPK